MSSQTVPWQGQTTHTPSTDRSLVTTRHQLGVTGILTALTLAVLSGSPKRDCFVTATLESAIGVSRGLLFRGYIDSMAAPRGSGAIPIIHTWYVRLDSRSSMSTAPVLQLRGVIIRDRVDVGGWSCTDESSLDGRGALKTVTGTNPPGVATGDSGGEISESVPVNARWVLIGVQTVLVTSATPAVRRINLVLDDGTDIISGGSAHVTQNQSLNYRYIWQDNYPNVPTGLTDLIFNNLATTPLSTGYRIRSSTTNLKMGDNYGAPILYVEEWLEE